MIVTSVSTCAIVVALEVVLMIDMTTETAIASQPLVTAKAKVTMPNTVTDLDHEHDHNQDPALMTLED